MNSNLLFDFTVNKKTNSVHVKREFAAGLEKVWAAWTTAELLDKWWAPKPYHTETKSMDFKEGGSWFYAMVSPTDEKHWCKVDYKKIEQFKSFSGLDAFCDEKGNINTNFPSTSWSVTFTTNGQNTFVNIATRYEKLEDLEKVIEMGFKEGFTMALENLDQYIEEQFKLRNQLKSNNATRVCSYLNFPGNTEEAFLFYKSVFKTNFLGKGIQRFGDLPANANHPPVLDSVKKMVLHVELPILGNHVLMGTDAPKEMGFDLVTGNNMHISLEPESREETQRIFDALSNGGTVSMPLEDMFFSAFFGSFTDKFGINWMLNYSTKSE